MKCNYSDMTIFYERSNKILKKFNFAENPHFRVRKGPLQIVLFNDCGQVKYIFTYTVDQTARFFNRFNNLLESDFCNIKSYDDLIRFISYIE